MSDDSGNKKYGKKANLIQTNSAETNFPQHPVKCEKLPALRMILVRLAYQGSVEQA